MIAPPLLTRHAVRLIAATGFIAVCAAALGWEAGETKPPPPAPIVSETWSLPPLKPEDAAKTLAVLNELRPWVGFTRPRSTQEARGKPRVAPWRLAGIIERDGESLVLIATGQGRTAKYEYRRIGDSFPDGTILVQITPDSAKTKSSSASAESHVYRLFNKNP